MVVKLGGGADLRFHLSVKSKREVKSDSEDGACSNTACFGGSY